MRRIGFLGCGKLGQALLAGWLDRGLMRPDEVLVAARQSGAQTAARLGVTASTREQVAASAELIVLAVKPTQVDAALADLTFTPEQLVISVAAGVSRRRLELAASPARVVRTMPNIACRVGQGATLVLSGPADRVEDVERVCTLFGAVGIAERVADERLFHAGTALVGSGPAFLFVAIEAMADGAVAAGMPRATALRLAAAAVRGAGAMAFETGEHPAALKDAVASPGGTTIAGLAVLERHALRAALIEAVGAATKRSEELETT